MLEQAFNYVEGVIGGNTANNTGENSWDVTVPRYSCKIQPYSGWAFILACWLLQYTIQAYIAMWVLSWGTEKPGLGKINAACAGAKGRN